jgi:hypothetical protein
VCSRAFVAVGSCDGSIIQQFYNTNQIRKDLPAAQPYLRFRVFIELCYSAGLHAVSARALDPCTFAACPLAWVVGWRSEPRDDLGVTSVNLRGIGFNWYLLMHAEMV